MIVVSLACAFTWLPWHQTDLKLNTRTFALSHFMHISTRNTGIPRRWTEILEKPFRVPLTKNSLQVPLVAGKEVSGRKLIKGDCCTVLLFFKKKKKILGSRGICIRIKHYGRVCFVIHCSAGMKRIRSILEVEQLGPFIWGKIRRILIVLNNTRTSQYKRQISTKTRRDQESWRVLAKIALSKNRC